MNLGRVLLRPVQMSAAAGGLKRPIGKRIGTHSGSFHCDEALGCYLLSRRTAEYAGAEIVRSRDPEVLKDLDVVIDVGGVYDPARRRFDHHQRGFAETFGHGARRAAPPAGRRLRGAPLSAGPPAQASRRSSRARAWCTSTLGLRRWPA